MLVPDLVPGGPAVILNPRTTWSDPDAYDAQAKDLARRFVDNFKQFQAARQELIDAGPNPD